MIHRQQLLPPKNPLLHILFTSHLRLFYFMIVSFFGDNAVFLNKHIWLCAAKPERHGSHMDENEKDLPPQAPAQQDPAEETPAQKEAEGFRLSLSEDDDVLLKPEEQEIVAPKKKKGKRYKKQAGCMKTMVYITAVCCISILLAAFALTALNDMLGVVKDDVKISVEIPKGATTKDVADILEQHNVISQKLTFRLYCKLTKADGTFQYGMYVLNAKDGYEGTVAKLQKTAPQKDGIEITIIEGAKLDDVVDQLVKAGVSDKEKLYVALKETYGSKAAAAIQPTENRHYLLEGYLFPAKYEFVKGEPEATTVKRFLNALDDRLTDKHYQRAQELGMTMDQVITLASVIQLEAGKKEEMVKVSSVFHNRLSKTGEFPGLQSDVTCWYPYDKRSDLPENLQSQFYNDNPYNTYKIQGLPPGPVCNPGLDAIEAALYPNDTQYTYFVTDKNGKYYYASTYAEHQKNCKTAKKAGITTGTATQSGS